MYEIDKEKFGQFIGQLRREKGMTQKELAEKLYVSDKAVSKWETAMHLPDISMLTPLAEVLGVSVAELLQGERMENESLQKEAVEDMVRRALSINEQEVEDRMRYRKRRIMAFIVCAILGAFQLNVLYHGAEYDFGDMSMALTFYVMGAAMGVYFVFLAEDRLPVYYDQHKISFYARGPLRMNMPGLHFNNSNWPHITGFIRKWCCGAMALAAGLFYMTDRLINSAGAGSTVLLVVLLGSLMVPVYLIGKKYE